MLELHGIFTIYGYVTPHDHITCWHLSPCDMKILGSRTQSNWTSLKKSPCYVISNFVGLINVGYSAFYKCPCSLYSLVDIIDDHNIREQLLYGRTRYHSSTTTRHSLQYKGWNYSLLMIQCQCAVLKLIRCLQFVLLSFCSGRKTKLRNWNAIL